MGYTNEQLTNFFTTQESFIQDRRAGWMDEINKLEDYRRNSRHIFEKNLIVSTATLAVAFPFNVPPLVFLGVGGIALATGVVYVGSELKMANLIKKSQGVITRIDHILTDLVALKNLDYSNVSFLGLYHDLVEMSCSPMDIEVRSRLGLILGYLMPHYVTVAKQAGASHGLLFQDITFISEMSIDENSRGFALADMYQIQENFLEKIKGL